jgi:SAM-dependent methyltransferase
VNSSLDLRHQQAFYDARWKDRFFINNAKLTRCIAILDCISSIKLVEPQIVELGSGCGWLTAMLGAIGPATGIELSPVAVAQARERYPSVNFIQADLNRWDYPREQFDLVISHEVLEHLHDQVGHLKLAQGLLRKGGYIILTTPNKPIYEDLLARGEVEMQPIENWMTEGDLRTMAQNYFEVIRLTTIRPLPRRRGVFRVFNYFRCRNLAERLGMRRPFETLVGRWGAGLHLLLLARKG